MERYVNVAGKFLFQQYLPHIVAAVGLCLLSGGFMSFHNLEEAQAAKIIEQYLILIGMLLFTPLFMAEQDIDIWQLERTKSMPMWKQYLIRLFWAVLSLGIIAGGFFLFLKSQNETLVMDKLFAGGFAELLFLGSVGYFASAVTNQVVIGYMMAVIYYVINVGGAKYLGKLALFQMTKGTYDFAGWMYLVAICLIAAGILIREIITAKRM